MSCFNLDRPAVNIRDKIYLLSTLLLLLFSPSISSSCNSSPPHPSYLLFSPLCILSRRWWYVLIVVILLLWCTLHSCPWEMAPCSDWYVCHMCEANMILSLKTLFSSNVISTLIKPIMQKWLDAILRVQCINCWQLWDVRGWSPDNSSVCCCKSRSRAPLCGRKDLKDTNKHYVSRFSSRLSRSHYTDTVCLSVCVCEKER